MFQHAYQSGSHLEIFDPKGLKQTEKINDKLFKISPSNMMTKTYDKYLKNYVYEVLPGTKANIQFPKDDRQELGLLQHYLVLQLFLGMDSSFTLELVISDTNTNKRRLIFTSSVKEIEKNHFHIKIPLENIKRGVWLNLSFDLLSYFELFPSSTFRALESFIISGNFKLRKIFTMKDPLMESNPSEESPALPYLSSNGGILSKAVNYGQGVTYENQIVFFKPPQTQQREYQTPIKPPRDSKQSTQNLSGSFNINTPTLLSFMGRAGKHRAEDSLDMSSKLKSNNTSRFMDASKSPHRHKSKENSAIYLNDPAKNSLASTADSQKCLSLLKLTSPTNNIKPRNFFSPRHEFQFPAPSTIKEDVSMRLSTEEPRVAPRSILLDQKQKSTLRITQKSNDKAKQTSPPRETAKKSKSTVRINKLHEIIELNEKASLYNRRMNQKKQSVASYLLPNLSSPKVGMIAPDLQTTTAALRSPNMNNPWANSQGELSFPFSRHSTTKFNNASGFKTPRGASEKPVPVKLELKPVRAKESFDKSSSKGSLGGLSRKEIITTAATTPKDMMMSDSDRFSILSRSGDEYGIRNRNREIIISHEEANYKDEIESIEENLEYENHSNTSGICASHILNNEEEDENAGFEIFRGDKSTSPDLYKPFIKKENEEENSTGSVIYHGGRKGRQLSKLDTGKTKRIAKQFEDKVMDIVSNNRPYSPPFQRKVEAQKPSWFVKRESISSLQKAAMILRTEQDVPTEKEEIFERALQTDRYGAN